MVWAVPSWHCRGKSVSHSFLHAATNRSCRPASLASGWLRVISDMRLDEFGDEWPPFEMGCRPGPWAKLLPRSLRFMTMDILAALFYSPLVRVSEHMPYWCAVDTKR